jgi:hypothetical protein
MRHRTTTVFAAVALAGCVVAACSSGSPPAPATASSSPPPATAPTSSASANPAADWPTTTATTRAPASLPISPRVGNLRQSWHADLDGAVYGTPQPSSQLPCGNISPLGITGTMAYDQATGRVFAVAETPRGAHTCTGSTCAPGRSPCGCPSTGLRIAHQRRAHHRRWRGVRSGLQPRHPVRTGPAHRTGPLTAHDSTARQTGHKKGPGHRERHGNRQPATKPTPNAKNPEPACQVPSPIRDATKSDLTRRLRRCNTQKKGAGHELPRSVIGR